MNTIFSLSLKSAAREPFLLFWSILMPIGGTLILGFLVGNSDYTISITTGMMAMGILFYAFTTIIILCIIFTLKRVCIYWIKLNVKTLPA